MMWSGIIASVATIGAVFYMQGPIVALALTAAGSLALLVAMRIGEQKAQALTPQPQSLQVIDGSKDIDLRFPPLRQRAS